MVIEIFASASASAAKAVIPAVAGAASSIVGSAVKSAAASAAKAVVSSAVTKVIVTHQIVYANFVSSVIDVCFGVFFFRLFRQLRAQQQKLYQPRRPPYMALAAHY